MNSLDFILIIGTILYFSRTKTKSATFYMLVGLATWVGYVIGMFILGAIAPSLGIGLSQGLLYLAIPFVIALGCGLIMRPLADRIKTRVLLTGSSKLDGNLTQPTKILVAFLTVLLLAQTLPYIPFTSLQFVAQGSFVVFNVDRSLPDSPLANVAANIYPNQFAEIVTPTDPDPITFDGTRNIDREIQNVVNAIAPSSVKIISEGCQYAATGGLGSGFFVAPHYVATNAHVVAGAVNIYIETTDGNYPATPIYINNRKDTAILYTRYVARSPMPIVGEPAPVGEKVFVIGYPAGNNMTVTTGEVISSKVGFTDRSDLNADNTIVTNARSIPGNSGSPILNYNGEVVGLLNSGGEGRTVGVEATYIKPIIEDSLNKRITTKTGLCDVFTGL